MTNINPKTGRASHIQLTFSDDYYFRLAFHMIDKGLSMEYSDPFALAELLKNIEYDKHEQDEVTDQLLDFDDEIVSIEEYGTEETVDITVSKDNLFYANGLLTKNSFGLPATADFFVAAISSPELEEQGLLMFKQLKNRYGALGGENEKFVVGVNKAKMRLYDPEDDAQENVNIMGKASSKSQQEVLDAACAAPQFGKKKTASAMATDDEFTGFDFS